MKNTNTNKNQNPLFIDLTVEEASMIKGGRGRGRGKDDPIGHK